MNSIETSSRLLKDYQSRSAGVADKERALQQRQSTLMELKLQIQNVQDDLQKRRAQLSAATSRFKEKSNVIVSKVEEKENHNQTQTGHLAFVQEEERKLNMAVEETVQRIDAASASLLLKQEESQKLQRVEVQVTQLKNALEEDDCALMQLDSALARSEAETLRRYSELSEKLPMYPLPQLASIDTNSLEGTAGESVILVDEF